MEILHRYNTKERQHYLLEKHYSFRLKPRLLYVGSLDKQGGWREEPHSHDFLEIVFVVDGCGTVDVGGNEYEIRRGDILVYNAGLTHFERSSINDPLEVRFVAYDKLEITELPPDWLLPPAYGFLFHSGEMYDTFCRYFEMLIREFEQRERFYAEIVQNVSRTLLMYLFRLVNQTENTAGLLASSQTMDLALKYIDGNYRREISLEELAQVCHANKYYLSHLFSRIQGVSVGKYILCRRLDEAKRLLLQGELTVGAVAEACGFDDANYFSRVFKRETGQTPRAFRRSSQQ